MEYVNMVSVLLNNLSLQRLVLHLECIKITFFVCLERYKVGFREQPRSCIL